MHQSSEPSPTQALERAAPPLVDMQALQQALHTALAAEAGSVAQMLAFFAHWRGSHAALVLAGEVLDYAALHAQVDQAAAALQRDGLRPGDAIALCAATSVAYVVAYLGAIRAGVVVAPLPPSATAEQLTQLAANAKARCIFLDAQAAVHWPAALSQAPCVLLDGSAPAGTPAWQAWCAEAGQPTPAALAASQPFNIIYSSGTTGQPKGIVQTYGMRWAQLQRSPDNGFGPDAVTLLAIPPYSNLMLTYLLGALGVGGTVVLMAKFDAGQYLALAQRYGATHSVLVPVQFQRLLDHADFDSTDLSKLQHKFSAGAPFSAALKQSVLQRWPGALTEYYGMTEGGGRTELQAHLHPDKLHTIGQPSRGNDIRLIDEQGQELPNTAVGEIVGHSATMMQGYYGLPEKTREAQWFDASGKRFIRTGDVGRYDADGFLVLVDRRKDMIISGGFNIFPSDLEAVLAQHPAIADVAVVGVASDAWGETPIAFVVLKPQEQMAEMAGPMALPVGALALKDWANARLGKAQRLAAVQVCGQLPRSEVGKVLKRALRDSWEGRAA